MLKIFSVGTALFTGFIVAVSVTISPFIVYADGMPDEEVVKKPAPVAAPAKVEEPAPVAAPVKTAEEWIDDPECWHTRLSAGVGPLFFDEEDTTAFPGMYLDFWRPDYPINLRVGVEGRHMDLHQPNADASAEFPGKTTEITLVKIPFAVEWYHKLTEELTLYAGGGPDIINTANDIGETSVGFHLGSRLHYAFNYNWGVGVEGGYMWGEVDSPGGDIDLDHAYVMPQLSYTF